MLFLNFIGPESEPTTFGLMTRMCRIVPSLEGGDALTTEEFIIALRASVDAFADELTSDDGTWSVKGVIDDHELVYPIPLDTKLSSKIMEMQLHPHMVRFAAKHGFRCETPAAQNHYPDYTFIDEATGEMFAVDIKTTYRVTATTVNGMTLGSYFGYMRGGTANIMYPYHDYEGHVVLGVIYSQGEEADGQPVAVDDLDSIECPVHDFSFFVQEKFRVAVDRPGSGNTRNIGSVSRIAQLTQGTGPFAGLGTATFEDYWSHYYNAADARAAGLSGQPYRNIAGYQLWKAQQ